MQTNKEHLIIFVVASCFFFFWMLSEQHRQYEELKKLPIVPSLKEEVERPKLEIPNIQPSRGLLA